MKSFKVLIGVIVCVLMFISSKHSLATDINTDPDVQKEISHENWMPGTGKYDLFSSSSEVPGSRGTVTKIDSNINIIKTSSIRSGSVLIEQANIEATHNFTKTFFNHPYTEHRPSTVTRSDSSSTIVKTENKKISLGLIWNGRWVHPDNGYDGEQGGGFPAPIGAVDYHNYTITGTASGTYVLSTQEQQKYDVAPANNHPVKGVLNLNDQNLIASSDQSFGVDNKKWNQPEATLDEIKKDYFKFIYSVPSKEELDLEKIIVKDYPEEVINNVVDLIGGAATGTPEASADAAWLSLNVIAEGGYYAGLGEVYLKDKSGIIDETEAVKEIIALEKGKKQIKEVAENIKEKGESKTEEWKNRLDGTLGYTPDSFMDQWGEFIGIPGIPVGVLSKLNKASNFNRIDKINKINILGEASQGLQKNIKISKIKDTGVDDVWSMKPLTPEGRGYYIDALLGNNLGPRFPVVDKLDGKVLTSIKSLDTSLPSYQTASGIKGVLKKDIDTLKSFKEGSKEGSKVTPSLYNKKVLEIAIPENSLNTEQVKVINEMHKYAKSIDNGTDSVELTITIVK